MTLESVVDILWTHTWWSYDRDRELSYSLAYRVFNLIEGTVWLCFSAMVLVRRSHGKKSTLEKGYALAFFTFALSDFRESYYQQSWLIWLKLMNLVLLLWMRRAVMTQLYPGSRIY